MQSDPQKLLKKNQNLTHSEMQKVVSHVQRDDDDWVINTVMIEGCDVPFKFKRKEQYKNLNSNQLAKEFEKNTEIEAELYQVIKPGDTIHVVASFW